MSCKWAIHICTPVHGAKVHFIKLLDMNINASTISRAHTRSGPVRGNAENVFFKRNTIFMYYLGWPLIWHLCFLLVYEHRRVERLVMCMWELASVCLSICSVFKCTQRTTGVYYVQYVWATYSVNKVLMIEVTEQRWCSAELVIMMCVWHSHSHHLTHTHSFYWHFKIKAVFLLGFCDYQSSELCVHFDRFRTGVLLVLWQMSCLTLLYCLYSFYTLSAVSRSEIQYQHTVCGSVQFKLKHKNHQFSSCYPSADVQPWIRPERDWEREKD